MKDRDPDLVTAAEIASWAWCPESWRLQSLGNEPANRASMDKGRELHASQVIFEGLSRSAISLGWWLVASAALLALLALIQLARG